MRVKRRPHHDLSAIQVRFAELDALEITNAARRDAQRLGYALEEIRDVVQALSHSDFKKSETAHSPPNPRVWHDTYNISFDGRDLYLKFAGETSADVVLTSFKGK